MTTLRPVVDAAARAASAAHVERVFRASGALRDGHFQLASGRHGDADIESTAVLSHLAATRELCAYWAAEHRAPDGSVRVDVVAGPSTGGAILAFETGRQLGTRSISPEEVRRGATIAAGERVLLVDDVLTTGEPLLSMIPSIEAQGGEIVACRVLVDRSADDRATIVSPTTGRRYPLAALWRLTLPTWEPGPDSCPRCAAGAPLQPPGSTGRTGSAIA